MRGSRAQKEQQNKQCLVSQLMLRFRPFWIVHIFFLYLSLYIYIFFFIHVLIYIYIYIYIYLYTSFFFSYIHVYITYMLTHFFRNYEHQIFKRSISTECCTESHGDTKNNHLYHKTQHTHQHTFPTHIFPQNMFSKSDVRLFFVW